MKIIRNGTQIWVETEFLDLKKENNNHFQSNNLIKVNQQLI